VLKVPTRRPQPRSYGTVGSGRQLRATSLSVVKGASLRSWKIGVLSVTATGKMGSEFASTEAWPSRCEEGLGHLGRDPNYRGVKRLSSLTPISSNSVPSVPKPKTCSNAAKQKLYRTRRDLGIMVVPVEVDWRVLEMLVGVKCLTEATRAAGMPGGVCQVCPAKDPLGRS